MGAEKVLLIEDDPMMVRMYQTKFEHDGYKVFLAFEGQSGLELAQKEQPDIILTDVMMPKMDGFEVLRRLKEDPKTKDIPVVLLTNLGGEQADIDRAINAGAADYLVKSQMQPKEVVEKIKELLNK